jgi:hypothetical protein
MAVAVHSEQDRSSPVQERRLFTAFFFALTTVVMALPIPVSPLTAVVLGLVLTLLAMVLRPGGDRVSIAVVALSFALLLKADLSGLPPLALVAGCVGLAVALSPFVLRPLGRYEGYPFVHLFGLISASYLAVGFLVGRSLAIDSAPLSVQERTSGLWWFAIFLLCVVVGALVVRQRAGPVIQRGNVEWPHTVQRAVILIVVGYALSITIGLLGAASSLGAIPTLVDQLRYAGFLVLWLGWLRRRIPLWLVALAAVTVGATVIAGFGTGSLYAGLTVPIGALCLYVAERRRVPWITIGLVLVVALTLNVAKTPYRQQYVQGAAQPLSTLDRSTTFVGFYFSTLARLSKTDLQQSASRFSYASGDVLGYSVATIPLLYPYWRGHTYAFLPLTIIPRVVDPSKPQATFGNQFGRRYGLISSFDVKTAQNLPVSAEGYVNLGKLGLVLEGLLVGLAFGLGSRWLRNRDVHTTILGSLIAVVILGGVESDSTVAFGLLPGLLIVSPLIVSWLIRRTEEPSTSKESGVDLDGDRAGISPRS